MLKKVKPVSLVESIAEQLEEAILSGEFRPGDKLPSAQKLQETFGASQGSVREALRVLMQKGLIEVKQGVHGGAFVKRGSLDNLSQSLALLIRLQQVSWRDLAQFRNDMEGIVVRRAARRATADDLQKLEAIVARAERMRDSGNADWEEFVSLDTELHLTIAEIAGNPLHESVLRTVLDNITFYFEDFRSYEDEYIGATCRTIQELVQAIEEGDEERAYYYSQQHLYTGLKYAEDAAKKKMKDRSWRYRSQEEK